jgi:hypothetical protein
VQRARCDRRPVTGWQRSRPTGAIATRPSRCKALGRLHRAPLCDSGRTRQQGRCVPFGLMACVCQHSARDTLRVRSQLMQQLALTPVPHLAARRSEQSWYAVLYVRQACLAGCAAARPPAPLWPVLRPTDEGLRFEGSCLAACSNRSWAAAMPRGFHGGSAESAVLRQPMYLEVTPGQVEAVRAR